MNGAKTKGRKGEAPSAAEFLEGVDFLELWTDKLFLGREFLTWLFLRSEESGRVMRLPGGAEVEVWFESRLELALGSGPLRKSVSVATPEDPFEGDWREAFAAAAAGKMVTRGALRVKSGSAEWRLALVHDALSPQGVKFSPGAEEDGAGGGPDALGKMLGRLASAAELAAVLDGLFQSFITLRLSPEWEAEELSGIRRFLEARK